MIKYPDLWKGELVRLSAEEPQTIADNFNRWIRSSEYSRQLDSFPARMWSIHQIKEWFKKTIDNDLEKEPFYFFGIRTLADDRLIGEVGLDGIQWNNGDTFVGISIGEKDDWSKGYGTDAMRLILRFAFAELNLRRVSLTVFEYNPRALRSYQKAGFKEEGRMREYLNRDGRRWDMIFMGILREEWLALEEARHTAVPQTGPLDPR
jgi:RimJ/RimL family protein N-acetyltransferase